MPSLIDLILQGSPVEQHRPWPCAIVDQTGWISAANALSDGHWTLLGIWGEANAVHMTILEEPTATVGIVRLHCAWNAQFVIWLDSNRRTYLIHVRGSTTAGGAYALHWGIAAMLKETYVLMNSC
jgi:hypothetical protein